MAVSAMGMGRVPAKREATPCYGTTAVSAGCVVLGAGCGAGMLSSKFGIVPDPLPM